MSVHPALQDPDEVLCPCGAKIVAVTGYVDKDGSAAEKRTCECGHTERKWPDDFRGFGISVKW